MKAVVIFSGGLDSTTALYEAVKSLGVENVEAVSFAYGQRHSRELVAARFITKRELIPHNIVDLGGIPYMGMAPAEFMKGGSLTGGEAVPHGHYEAPTMKSTVVPNRNMIFIAIAAARLMQSLTAEETGCLYIGVHDGDHAIYPDCRAAFIESMDDALREMSDGRVFLKAPYLDLKKGHIVARGTNYFKVPYADTWSCYEGGELHCGKCGTCVERKEAFEKAGVTDPTTYAT